MNADIFARQAFQPSSLFRGAPPFMIFNRQTDFIFAKHRLSQRNSPLVFLKTRFESLKRIELLIPAWSERRMQSVSPNLFRRFYTSLERGNIGLCIRQPHV